MPLRVGLQTDFPPSLESYDDSDLESIPKILAHRVEQVPFNLVATLIFFCAIVHTFMASKFSALSHMTTPGAQEEDRRWRGEAGLGGHPGRGLSFPR